MKYRKLLVAWSAVWGIATVILIVCWARSYHHIESLVLKHWPGKCTVFDSVFGNVYIGFYEGPAVFNFSSAPIARGQFFDSGTSTVVVRHSFLVFGGFATAVAPWILLIKRFSLRTLLIATTLFCVLLGLIVWLSR
jgi:hypothetical protein